MARVAIAEVIDYTLSIRRLKELIMN